jgi:two-component system OmpR family sensor kinase
MTTIRRRLAFWYTVALGITVVGFGGALYLERGQSSVRELDRRLGLESDLATRWLVESYRVLGSLVGSPTNPSLAPGISAYLEAFRDYLVLADTSHKVVALSGISRGLTAGELEQLSAPARTLTGRRLAGTLDVGGSLGTMRYLATRVDSAGPGIGWLVVATPTEDVAFGPTALLRSMLVIAPIVLLCSAALGWWLAGTSVQPLLGIMDELDAITDGRSLHRRLAVPLSGDEISRLVVTLNGMLARLEQSFSSLRRFTADASHELKTPLMVLRAGVERGLTHPQTPRDVLQSLDETLAVEESDLREVVADVSETAGILGEDAQVRVTTHMPEGPVLLQVDKHRIRELMLNLVTNAIKYTPAGGLVGLSLTELDGAVTLTVSDTGVGIAPGDLPHIFDRFWRADPARSRTGERAGTGLGLAITKWIAEAHGGSITVQSRPGRGTVFTVHLPRTGPVDGTSVQTSQSATPEPSPVSHREG